MSDIIKSQMKNFSLRKFAAFSVEWGGGGGVILLEKWATSEPF